jgi:hypothetical protein
MDAIDKVIAMHIGKRFVLRGRRFTLRGYEGWSHYADHSRIPVWNERGRATVLRVKPSDIIAQINNL